MFRDRCPHAPRVCVKRIDDFELPPWHDHFDQNAMLALIEEVLLAVELIDRNSRHHGQLVMSNALKFTPAGGE